MRNKFFFVIFMGIVFFQGQISAQLRLPAVIGSNMVLQQQDSVALWGWAGPGEKVFVTTGWDNKSDSVKVSNGARWKLKVKTPAAGGPFNINITTRGKTITLQNVMIGEVWVCSGQSNMEWSYNNGEKDTRNELAGCATNNIHFLNIPKTTADAPQDDIKAEWTACDSITIKGFSAVGYFFGKKLQQQLNVPIGLINSSWGGTPAEVWAPEEAVTTEPVLKAAAAKLTPAAWWPHQPGLAYNAMIAPFVSYNIAGAIWYQGESNTNTNDTYSKLLGTMIGAWRTAWKKDFPFYYVQIAPYLEGNDSTKYGTALFRETQQELLKIKNTGMAVTMDVGETRSVHPRDKRSVGERLAYIALNKTYGLHNVDYEGPQISHFRIDGNVVTLFFKADGTKPGLTTKDGKAPQHFYVAGDDHIFYPADAKIVGDNVVLGSEHVDKPVAVRYAFTDGPVTNFENKDGLPALPFRTDEWKK